MRDAAVPFHTPTSSLFLPARGEGRERWFGRGLRGFRLVILSVSDPPLPTQSARASCGRGSFPFTLTAPPLSPTLPASRPPRLFCQNNSFSSRLSPAPRSLEVPRYPSQTHTLPVPSRSPQSTPGPPPQPPAHCTALLGARPLSLLDHEDKDHAITSVIPPPVPVLMNGWMNE